MNECNRKFAEKSSYRVASHRIFYCYLKITAACLVLPLVCCLAEVYPTARWLGLYRY